MLKIVNRFCRAVCTTCVTPGKSPKLSGAHFAHWKSRSNCTSLQSCCPEKHIIRVTQPIASYVRDTSQRFFFCLISISTSLMFTLSFCMCPDIVSLSYWKNLSLLQGFYIISEFLHLPVILGCFQRYLRGIREK